MKIAGHMLLGFAAIALLGCGDDEGPTESSARGGGTGGEGGSSAVTRKVAVEVMVEKGYPNERWDKLKVHFLGLQNDPSTGFRRTAIGTMRDPFEPMLVKFVPRVDLDPTPSEEDEAMDIEALLPEIENTPQPVALGPTERFRTQDYNLLMIRWGTSVNKALVQDPSGETYVITRDMKLGNNNGRVVDITRYDVTVKEDSRNEPILLSIQPGILRINTSADQSNDKLFTNQASPE